MLNVSPSVKFNYTICKSYSPFEYNNLWWLIKQMHEERRVGKEENRPDLYGQICILNYIIYKLIKVAF